MGEYSEEKQGLYVHPINSLLFFNYAYGPGPIKKPPALQRPSRYYEEKEKNCPIFIFTILLNFLWKRSESILCFFDFLRFVSLQEA